MSLKDEFNQSLAAAIVRKTGIVANNILLGKTGKKPAFKTKNAVLGAGAVGLGTIVGNATDIGFIKGAGKIARMLGLYFVNDAVVGHLAENTVPTIIEKVRKKPEEIPAKVVENKEIKVEAQDSESTEII